MSFRNMLDAIERKFPDNPEEERRKNQYPTTCHPCKNIQCPYRREENYGKACQMQWKPKENTKMEPTSKHNANEELLRAIEKGLENGFKPLTDRIGAIEEKIRNEADYHSPAYSTNIKPFNGKGERLPTRVDVGLNQTRITEEKIQND